MTRELRRESFVAAGFHALEPPQLAAQRDAIVRHKPRWRKPQASLAASGLALSRETR